MRNDFLHEDIKLNLESGERGEEALAPTLIAAMPRSTPAETERIADLCARLPQPNTIREIVLWVLKQKAQPPAWVTNPVLRLIEAVNDVHVKPLWSKEVLRWLIGKTRVSPEHTEREIAAWALGQMELLPAQKQAAANALAVTLEQWWHQDKKLSSANLTRGMARSFLLCLSVDLLIATMALIFAPGSFDPVIALAIMAPLTVMFGSVLSLFFLTMTLNQNKGYLNAYRTAAATALGRLLVPESVDALATAVHDPAANVRLASVEALQAVLPTLTYQHYGRLGPDTVPNLCRLLSYPVLNPLTAAAYDACRVCVLNALKQVGDGRAIGTVMWLMQKSDASAEVRQVAGELAPILQERQRQEQDRSMLLRGSQAVTATEGLLRPAADTMDHATEQLLRPGSSE